jgi:hypothetical protein
MALVLNGSSQYAEIANGYSGLFASLTTSTFSAWFRASSFATQPFIISTKGRSTGSFFVELNTGTGIYWGTNFSTSAFIENRNMSFATNTWIHFVAVRHADGKGRMWFNGEAEFSATIGPYAATGTDLYLGRYDSGLYLPGKLYDIRVWNRVVFPAEIRRVWAGQSVTSGLTAHWLLNESSGTTFADSAGSLPGTLFNTPSWDSDVPTYGTLDSVESSGGVRMVNVRGGADQ